jgi:starvation-inducible DNA-binding protein
MIETSKQALANTFFMFNKAQAYHWNVEGINFPQYHKFFGKMYEEIQESIDTFAEQLRALGEYAPRNIEELYEHKTIDSMNVGNTVVTMVADLIAANNETINSLNNLFEKLDSAKEQGFADFVASRIDAHKKHGWMLRSCLKTGE